MSTAGATPARVSTVGAPDGGAVARPASVYHVPLFELEGGAVLRDVRQAYHLDGELDRDGGNLILVFHALTGSSDAVGGWWREIAGDGRALDTRHHAVLCANLLGSCYGTTGAWEERRRPFPLVTTRDMARLAHLLVQSLGVRGPSLVVGGSLGGMVAMEYAATHHDVVRRAVVLAAPAAHTASAIAWNHIQRRAMANATTLEDGLEVARMVAMMTYRTPAELALRFGRDQHESGEYQVGRYLDHHGRKLRARFDPHSYLTLLSAMDTHDVGRGRGGVAAALAPLGRRMTGVGIPGDALYDDAEVRGWTTVAGANYREVRSPHGHDAFLLEAGRVGEILREALAT